MTTMELEMEVAEIKTRLRRVENALREQSGAQNLVAPPPNLPSNNEELMRWMRDQGLVRDPTPDELRRAAQWDELPDEEKDAHVRLMNSLVLDPPLSEIIISSSAATRRC